MSQEKVSLVNCDFTKKKTRLTSPHSLIACRLIGVTEEDLIFQTLDEYIKNNVECQYLEKELQEERYIHFENNRKELIELAKNQREFLLKEEESKNNNTINNTTTNNYNNFNSSTTIGNTHNHNNKTFKKKFELWHIGHIRGIIYSYQIRKRKTKKIERKARIKC